ncbi:MAG: hypothetical protein RJA98_4167 [Pseudomonadota bacterium]
MMSRQRRVPGRIERGGCVAQVQLPSSGPSRRLLLGLLASGLCAPCAAQTQSAAEPIELIPFAFSVGQTGAVGVTGRIWRIAADGAVTRATLFNREEDPVDARGRLSAAQMARVSQALAEADTRTLPAELSLWTAANPAVTVLMRGPQRVRLMSPAGQVPTLEAHPDATEDVRRFLRLQTVLRDVLSAALP